MVKLVWSRKGRAPIEHQLLSTTMHAPIERQLFLSASYSSAPPLSASSFPPPTKTVTPQEGTSRRRAGPGPSLSQAPTRRRSQRPHRTPNNPLTSLSKCLRHHDVGGGSATRSSSRRVDTTLPCLHHTARQTSEHPAKHRPGRARRRRASSRIATTEAGLTMRYAPFGRTSPPEWAQCSLAEAVT